MFSRKKFRDSVILFTTSRVRSAEHTKLGFNKYEIRHDDESWLPCTLENRVWVNFYGTIISKDKLDLSNELYDNNGYIKLTDEEIDDFLEETNDIESLEEYVKEVGPIEVKIYEGRPYIIIEGVTYEVSVLNYGYNEFRDGMAFIINDWVLPFRGELKNYIGKILKPGIYEFYDKILVLPPLKEDTEYSIKNIEGKLL